MSIKKRTQADVIEYIKNHASEDGELQQSLMDIAGQLGYSNATIHRTLKSLEEQGVIEVQPADKPTRPNTIIFNGPIQTADEILAQGVSLMNEIEILSGRVHEYVRESQRIIEGLRSQHEKGSDLESRIAEIVDMPDGNHYMMIVRKESDEEVAALKSASRQSEELQTET